MGAPPIEPLAIRRPVQLTGFGLLLLSYQTLGIIYSDIGTSPLYVLNGIWPSSGPAPSKEDVIGGISCIIWALTLLPLLKYVFVALRFGTDEGEGGCFALYHGLIPPISATAAEDRSLTGDSMQDYRSSKTVLSRFKWVLLPWTLLGTSLTLADGVFTPAVSVTSAVGGIAISAPSVSDKIIPISIVILLVLFLVQRFGTAKLSFVFSPVTLIWLALIGVAGIVNITKFPGIFRAFDPSRAVLRKMTVFVRTKDYDLLAGVLLCVTGCEALFANLGQFNMLSIQISFSCITYPALIFAYLGQGARLVVDGDDVISNVFYRTIPGPSNGPLFWIIYVFAILATLVASQAMITATFSLVQQLINMKCFPPLRMVYTSEKIQGQVYIPAINYSLAAVTLIVVGAFKSSSALTNAYGFAVATVMFVTTTLIAIQCHYVIHLPWVAGALVLVFFGFFDGLFWGAAVKKIPDGAWVPLMIGLILLITMLFWTWAKACLTFVNVYYAVLFSHKVQGLEDEFDGANRKNLRHFIAYSETKESKIEQGDQDEQDGQLKKTDSGIEEVSNDEPVIIGLESENKVMYLVGDSYNPSRELAVLPILAIFHKFASGRGIPHSFVGFLRQYPALPRVAIFLSVRVLPVARIPMEDRYIVTKVRSHDGFFGVTYQIGYREDFQVDVNVIVDEICKLERQAKGIDPRNSEPVIREIKEAATRTTHIVPHYNVVSHPVCQQRPRFMTPIMDWVRAVLIEEFYRRLVTMFPETANWLTSADEIIHVGVTARI